MKEINIVDIIKGEELLKEEHIFITCKVKSYSIRQSKKGNEFGILEVIDNSGEFKFFLFGETFKLNHANLKNKQVIKISGCFQPKRFDEKQLEFKIINVVPLKL